MPVSKQTGRKVSGVADFQRLFDSSPAVHYLAKATGDFGATYICKSVKAQLGYEPEHFTQDSNFWAKHIHRDDRQEVLANLEKLFENDRHSHEYRFQHADGGYRWMHDELVLVRDKEGNPLNIIGSWLDITGRKEAEDGLRLGEARFKEAQRIAGVGSWDWNVTTNKLWWSDEIYRIFGIEPQSFEATYEAFLERIHPEDRKIVDDAVERALSHRESYSIDHRIVIPDGTEKIVHEQAEVIFDEDGRPVRMAGTVQDITYRKGVEEALRDSEARYRMIVDTANEGIWVLDTEARISYVNRRLTAILGYGPEELVGRMISEFMDEDVSEQAARNMERRHAGVTEQFDFRFRHKDGSEVSVTVAATPMTDEDGEFVGAIGMVSDVSERRKLEAQLRQAQKMEVVGQLTGGIAHDFNNLLTIILGNLQLIEESSKQDDSLRASAQAALDAGFRGAELTKRLLAFSRQQVLVPQVVNINKLVTDITPLLTNTIGEDVALETRPAKGLWLTAIDPSQMENSLVNLAVNARDAMPAGGALIISTSNAALDEAYAGSHTEVASGQYVLVTMSDTGMGMPADVLANVFEPFFTTKEFGRSSGLGLSMVHGFAKQSKGHIDIQSDEGHGTTVKLYLPRSDAVSEDKEATSAPSASIFGGQETILVVEDRAAVRQVSTRLLKTLGYQVIEAGTGAEALILLDKHEDIDLLFTDMVMPGGMTGEQLASHTRERHPNVKVLYTSGYIASDTPDKEFKQIDEHVLNKPYRKEELARAIREALNRAS